MRLNTAKRVSVLTALYYLVCYMPRAVYTSYLPVYYNSVGLLSWQIGLLGSVGPSVSLFSLFFWGTRADRAKHKNRVLYITAFSSAALSVTLPLNAEFLYILAVMLAFNFFQCSNQSLADTITVEASARYGYKFSTMRAFGTAGFALVAVVIGYIAQGGLSSIFIVGTSALFGAALLTLTLPKVAGHQREKLSFFRLFLDADLMLVMGVVFVGFVPLGFYYGFFSIFLTDTLGGTTAHVGAALLIAACSEFPFLIFADRIVKRFGVLPVLLVALVWTAARWTVFGFVGDPLSLTVLNVMHCGSLIVYTYCAITYINNHVGDAQKASAQSLGNMVTAGLATICGSLGGGVLAGYIGIAGVFRLMACWNALGAIAFFLIYRTRISRQHTLAEDVNEA